MPFTPIHMGPGLLLKACAPRHFSLSVFTFTQILIDVEPLYHLVRGDDLLHQFFHTGLGATLIAFTAWAIGRPASGLALAVWNRTLCATRASFIAAAGAIPQRAALSGAVIGAASHLVLDSIMHHDVAPFAPFSSINPLLDALPLTTLEAGCLVAGILGAAGLGYRQWANRRASNDAAT